LIIWTILHLRRQKTTTLQKNLPKRAENRKSKKHHKKIPSTSNLRFFNHFLTADISEEADERRVQPGDKRGINYAMEKNRGLTRHRSRETKTPRTRLRNKYDKAVSKRRGAVRKMADKSRPYGGEATGIKSNVVRSVKLKF
jgi:hypothetical protein